MKATNKTETIDYIKWTGDNLFQVVEFIDSKKPDIKHDMSAKRCEEYKVIVSSIGLTMKTPYGAHIANIGDVIIINEAGDFWPVSSLQFDSTYDKHPEPRASTMKFLETQPVAYALDHTIGGDFKPCIQYVSAYNFEQRSDKQTWIDSGRCTPLYQRLDEE